MNNQLHYGGANNPFEPIKIIDYYGLNFSMGNALKYILRAGYKPGEPKTKDLRKAIDYLQHEIDKEEGKE